MQSHKDMDVWVKSVEFAEYIYKITQCYPNDEIFGLVLQIRRAAVSISTSIAEGAARKTTTELLQFLHVARSSAIELDTLLEISKRTYMTETKAIEKAKEKNVHLLKMLNAFIGTLKISA